MERKHPERQETAIGKWDQLDIKDQMVYIEQAEYLISKGYMTGNQSAIAKSIYERRVTHHYIQNNQVEERTLDRQPVHRDTAGQESDDSHRGSEWCR